MEFLNNCYDVKTGILCLSHCIDEPGFINTRYKSVYSASEIKHDTFPRVYDIWYYEGLDNRLIELTIYSDGHINIYKASYRGNKKTDPSAWVTLGEYLDLTRILIELKRHLRCDYKVIEAISNDLTELITTEYVEQRFAGF